MTLRRQSAFCRYGAWTLSVYSIDDALMIISTRFVLSGMFLAGATPTMKFGEDVMQ